tara:strand:+ start:982 stop:1491 length:510 start_codon:yes stop_codon:yes gene_type:complete
MKILFITILGVLYSQPLSKSDFYQDDRSRDKIKSMLIWELSNELELSPKQAEKFFPIFNIHRDKINSINQGIKSEYELFRNDKKANKNIQKSEVIDFARNSHELRKKTADMELAFLIQCQDILSAQQLLNLNNFKRSMIKKMGKNNQKKGSRKNRWNMYNRKKNKRKFW